MGADRLEIADLHERRTKADRFCGASEFANDFSRVEHEEETER